MGARYVLAVRCFWIMFWITLVFFCATMDGCRAKQAAASPGAAVSATAVPAPDRSLELSVDDVVKWLFLTLTALAVYIVKGMQTTQREMLSQVQGHDTRICVIETLCERHKGKLHE